MLLPSDLSCHMYCRSIGSKKGRIPGRGRACDLLFPHVRDEIPEVLEAVTHAEQRADRAVLQPDALREPTSTVIAAIIKPGRRLTKTEE